MQCLYQVVVSYVNNLKVRRLDVPVVDPEPLTSLGDRMAAAGAALVCVGMHRGR